MMTIECDFSRAYDLDRGTALLVQTYTYDRVGYKELIVDLDGDDTAGGDGWRHHLVGEE